MAARADFSCSRRLLDQKALPVLDLILLGRRGRPSSTSPFDAAQVHAGLQQAVAPSRCGLTQPDPLSPRLPTSRAGSAYLGLADVGLAPRGLAVAVGPHRGGGLQWAVSSLLGSSTLDVETAPCRRRNFFTRVSHKPGTMPAMIAETNTHDLKASEDAEAFHFLRSIEATLDDIARELAEMKAEARQFLTAHELSR